MASARARPAASDLRDLRGHRASEGVSRPRSGSSSRLRSVTETITGAKPLEVLKAAIPSALPAPVSCVSAYGTEEDLVLRVVLVDGRKLDYGSRCLPDELEPLYELAIAN
jgi:hypothetical protein